MKEVGYVVASTGLTHVSRYAVESLENALANANMPARRNSFNHKVARRAVQTLYWLGLTRNVAQTEQCALLVPMMGLQEHAAFPWVLYREIIPIIFDCLPQQFPDWKRFFVRSRIRTAFFTADVAADHFRRTMPHLKCLWLPEAIDVDMYSSVRPWHARSTDVLEFGRRYGRYHKAIKTGVEHAGLTHSYERERGHLVFPTKADFIAGLGDARISVCFPQSTTHPERFGTIETLTQRYLESMASGCALVGSTPRELIKLFGYDPVISVDWQAPVQQIQSILERPEVHSALRERNLETVGQAGSWHQRAQDLILLLSQEGYGVARCYASPSAS